jgi:hypothetical protein
MSTIYGFPASEIKPQPGFNATRDEKGAWTGTHSFAIRTTAWSNGAVRAQFAKGTSITLVDPGLAAYWEFLKIVEQTVTSEEGGFTMVQTKLSGGEGQFDEDELSDEAQPKYRLEGQLQDAPLSMHPKWVALTDEQKTALGFLISGNLVFDEGQGKVCRIIGDAPTPDKFFDPFLPYDLIIVGDALEFAKVIARGETTYLRPTFIWTESTQGADKLTNAQINLLGNISVPRGSPPEPAGTRDWMLTSAFQEQNGELYTTDLQWTLSEKGGHDEFLYES